MIIRPGLLRLIPMAFVSAAWLATVALGCIRGRKMLKEEKEKRKTTTNEKGS